MTSSVTIKPRLTETSALVTLLSTLTSRDNRLWSRIIDAPMLLHSAVKYGRNSTSVALDSESCFCSEATDMTR